jgi:hypothetical protein
MNHYQVALQKARARAVKARRELAQRLAASYRDSAGLRLTTIQTVIETIDRALADEEVLRS